MKGHTSYAMVMNVQRSEVTRRNRGCAGFSSNRDMDDIGSYRYIQIDLRGFEFEEKRNEQTRAVGMTRWLCHNRPS